MMDSEIAGRLLTSLQEKRKQQQQQQQQQQRQRQRQRQQRQHSGVQQLLEAVIASGDTLSPTPTPRKSFAPKRVPMKTSSSGRKVPRVRLVAELFANVPGPSKTNRTPNPPLVKPGEPAAPAPSTSTRVAAATAAAGAAKASGERARARAVPKPKTKPKSTSQTRPAAEAVAGRGEGKGKGKREKGKRAEKGKKEATAPGERPRRGKRLRSERESDSAAGAGAAEEAEASAGGGPRVEGREAGEVASRWTVAGLRCLVTGGSKGIGKATVEALAAQGATVYTCCRNKTELAKVIAQWRAKGYKVAGSTHDLSKPKARAALVVAVAAHFGNDGLDVLVNNVGMNIRKKTEDFTMADYDTLMGANVESCFDMTRLCFPLLKKARGGKASVVMNSSVAGGPTTMKSGSLYGMSKGAMNQFTKLIACEWAKFGIRCNAVAPWYTNTPLAQQVLADESYKRQVLARTPMGRTGEPEEVADVIAFLCMPASAFVTGQIIAVDGGYSSMGFW